MFGPLTHVVKWRDERCAHPHRRDTRKWSDDYHTGTRTRCEYGHCTVTVEKIDQTQLQ